MLRKPCLTREGNQEKHDSQADKCRPSNLNVVKRNIGYQSKMRLAQIAIGHNMQHTHLVPEQDQHCNDDARRAP